MGSVWFGTRDKMQWVQAPAVSLDASKFDWAAQTNFLNGGANVRRSVASHKEYQMAWDLTSRALIRVVTDYADGLFGSGAIYWVDPFAINTNLLPAYWASPFMGAFDGVNLTGTTTAPTLTPTAVNTNGYPTQSAVYTVAAGTKPTVWVPIPAGYTLWIGAHGVAGTGGVVVATPTTGPTTIGTPVNLTMLSVTTTTLVNQSFDYASGYDGVLISLGGTGTVTLSGIVVQAFPTGVTPPLGSFVSGQGHSGCTFAAQPTLTLYNAPMDLVGLTAKLVETQAWV
jgi:hypothetical protein